MKITIKNFFILIITFVWLLNITEIYATCYNSEADRVSSSNNCAWPSGYYSDAILYKNSSGWFCCKYSNTNSNDPWFVADWSKQYEDTAEKGWTFSWGDVGQNFVERTTDVDTAWIDWVNTWDWLWAILWAINSWWDVDWAIDSYLSDDKDSDTEQTITKWNRTASNPTDITTGLASSVDWATVNDDGIIKLSSEDCNNPEYAAIIAMDNADPWKWVCD